MKIYISGKITGETGYIEKFKKAEEYIKFIHQGNCEVINPAIIMQTMPESTTHDEYMRLSLCLLDMCDVIYMLPDWKESTGAGIEYRHAQEKGIYIIQEVGQAAAQEEDTGTAAGGLEYAT